MKRGAVLLIMLSSCLFVGCGGPHGASSQPSGVLKACTPLVEKEPNPRRFALTDLWTRLGTPPDEARSVARANLAVVRGLLFDLAPVE